MISSETERKKQRKKGILLQTDKLCKAFSVGGLQQHVLKNLDLTIYEEDFTVIMGTSGSRKSTLSYVLSGMDQPTLGMMKYGQMDTTGLGVSGMAAFHRKSCGFVFQQIHSLDNMSVLDNVLVSGLLTSKDQKTVTARGKQLLSQVGILEADWGKFPVQFSGGEVQRVDIVRALMNEPNLVFVDEPTRALNSNFGEQVLDTFTGTNKMGQSLVMVTHDIKTTRRVNRVICLGDGMIYGECELGTYEKHDRNRYEKLGAFLVEMRW